MKPAQIRALKKDFKEHLRKLGSIKILSVSAERYLFRTQDLTGYNKRLEKIRSRPAQAKRIFNQHCRMAISTRIKIFWETDRCCIVSHKIRDSLMLDTFVFGTPKGTTSKAANFAVQQQRAEWLEAHNIKLEALRAQRNQAAAELAAMQVTYQKNAYLAKGLRATMKRSPMEHGLAVLEPRDLIIVSKMRELRAVMHLVKKAVPFKQRKIAALDKRIDKLSGTWLEDITLDKQPAPNKKLAHARAANKPRVTAEQRNSRARIKEHLANWRQDK